MQNNAIKLFIDEQAPKYIADEFPNFIKLMEYYYEFLEQEGNSYDAIRNMKKHLNINSDSDLLLDSFIDQYIPKLPPYMDADTKLVIKNIRHLYKNKGNEDSFKFLFRILFNEDVDIYYPKEDIFKLSDGEWSDNNISLKCSSFNNASTFLFETIKQYDNNDNLIASAVVEATQEYNLGKYQLTELFISNIVGTFQSDLEIVYDDNGTLYKETVIPVLGQFEIVDGGTDQIENKRIFINNGYDYIRTFNYVSGSQTFDLNISTLFEKDDIIVKVDSTPTTNFTLTDGKDIEILDSLSGGEEIQVELPSYGGYAETQRIKDGVITQAVIRDFGIGFSVDPTLDLSNFTGVDITSSHSDTANYEGYYKDTGGFPSFGKKLQDSYFFQEYSYMLKAKRSINRYGKIVKDLIHPSGYKLFGAVELKNDVDMSVSINDALINTLNIIELHLSSPYGHGNNYTYIERYKLKFQEYNDRFDEITLDDINDHRESTNINLESNKIGLIENDDRLYWTLNFEDWALLEDLLNILKDPHMLDSLNWDFIISSGSGVQDGNVFTFGLGDVLTQDMTLDVGEEYKLSCSVIANDGDELTFKLNDGSTDIIDQTFVFENGLQEVEVVSSAATDTTGLLSVYTNNPDVVINIRWIQLKKNI